MHPIMFLFVMLFWLVFLNEQKSYGFTYESQDWWFGPEGQISQSGKLGIIFTYPDTVIANDSIDVNVRIEYMENEVAQPDFIILDNMKVHLRDMSRATEFATTNESKSSIKLTGEIYNENFHLFWNNTSQNLPADLAIDLSFDVYFVTKTQIEPFHWDSGDKYGNSIEAYQLKPIRIINNTDTSIDNELTIRVNNPFGSLVPISISIDNSSHIIRNGLIKFNESNVTDINANTSSHQFNESNTYNLKIEPQIPLLTENNESIIRAAFLSWSDGSNNSSRVINLDENKELFAIFGTQFLLSINSSDPNNRTNGSGWYKSGDTAQITALVNDNIGADLFSYWQGDLEQGSDLSSPSQTVVMNEPKDVVAVWKQSEIVQTIEQIAIKYHDLIYGFIAAAIIGPIIGWGLSILPSRIEKKKQLAYLNAMIPIIDKTFNDYKKDKSICLDLLNQKRNEIVSLLQAGIMNIDTYRILDEHILEYINETNTPI